MSAVFQRWSAEMSETVQFIIVTHNKITMEMGQQRPRDLLRPRPPILGVSPLRERAARETGPRSRDAATAHGRAVESLHGGGRAATPTRGSRSSAAPTRSRGLSAGNRMVAFPYTKYMNAVLETDQAACVWLMSAAAARAAGDSRGAPRPLPRRRQRRREGLVRDGAARLRVSAPPCAKRRRARWRCAGAGLGRDRTPRSLQLLPGCRGDGLRHARARRGRTPAV